jgi:hypothetical protein
MDVLKRAADWFRAGGGNDQVLVRKPGGSASGAAGRDRISGAGAGSRGQRIGSGQTCPVRHRARAVLAARCRRRSFSRCRFLRGCTAGLLALRCQTRLACQHGQVQDRSQELGAGSPLGVLQFPQGLAADLAAGGDSGCPRIHGRRRDHGRWREHRSRRGYRSRCDDGIRGSGGRGRGRRFGENNILESLPWTGRINRRCRACHWRNRRQRGRNHRLGGHRHRGGGRGGGVDQDGRSREGVDRQPAVLDRAPEWPRAELDRVQEREERDPKRVRERVEREGPAGREVQEEQQEPEDRAPERARGQEARAEALELRGPELQGPGLVHRRGSEPEQLPRWFPRPRARQRREPPSKQSAPGSL